MKEKKTNKKNCNNKINQMIFLCSNDIQFLIISSKTKVNKYAKFFLKGVRDKVEVRLFKYQGVGIEFEISGSE